MKASTAISSGTVMILTGHPIVPVVQHIGAVTQAGNSVNIKISSEQIEFSLDNKSVSSDSWLRFAFSYICTN